MFRPKTLLVLFFIIVICFVIAQPTSAILCGNGRYSRTLLKCADCPCGSLCPLGVKTTCWAGYQSKAKATVCTDCLVGHYCPAAQCYPGKPCPSGTYNNKKTQKTSAACLSCAAGTYSTSGSSSCTPCEKGTASNSVKTADACPKCLPSFYQASTGLKTCDPVGPGYFSEEGQSTKTPCPVGSVCPKAGGCADACTLCAASQYQDKTTQLACKPVGIGHWSSEGASKKEICLAGTYCGDAAGCADKCVDASIGFYVPEDQASRQLPCTIGHFCPSTKMVTPTPCVPGFWSGTPGKRACDACEPGRASGHAASNCSICHRGYFAPEAASRCTLCAAGSYCSTQKCGFCPSCEPGTFSSSQGASSCNVTEPGYFTTAARKQQFPCPSGYFTNHSRTEGSCSMCAAGHECSRPATITPTLCGKGFYNPTGSTTPCRPCTAIGPGRYCNITGGAESDCVLADRGYYVDTADGKNATHQIPCPVDSYADSMGSTQCKKCTRFMYTNGTIGQERCIERPCCTPTYTRSASTTPSRSRTVTRSLTPPPTPTRTHHATSTKEPTATGDSASSSRSVSDPHNSSSVSETGSRRRTFSLSRSYDYNSSSISKTLPPTLSRTFSRTRPPTPSHDPSATASLAATRTATATRTHPPTASAHYITPSESATASNFSSTPELPITVSSTRSSSRSKSAVVNFPPPIGLSAAAQAAIQQTTGVMSVLASVAAAPAAMTMLRGSGIMKLVGCPERNPADEKKWQDGEISFPGSLLPGYGFSATSGFYYRGSVLGFLIVMVVATIIGILLLESTGRYQERDLEDAAMIDEEVEEELEAERKKKRKEDNNSDDGDGDGEQLLSPEEDRGDYVAKKVRRIPQVLYTVTSAILGLWAPVAGLLFSTFQPLDVCLAIIPLAILFSMHGYLVHRVRLSINKMPEMRGLLFVSSFVMQNSQIASMKKALKSSSSSSSSAAVAGVNVTDMMTAEAENDELELILRDRSTWGYRLKRLLESSIGRYLFMGHYFWTRPKGVRGYEARKILAAIGPHCQKFRGPRAVVDFLASRGNPFSDEAHETGVDTFSSMLAPRQHGVASLSPSESPRGDSSSNSIAQHFLSPESEQREQLESAERESRGHRNATLFAETRDFEPHERPPVEELDKGGWICRVTPHQLYISWWTSLLCGFLTGVALAIPEACPTLVWVVAGINIASFLLFAVMRPFVVPFRNHVMFIMELVVALTSLMVLLYFRKADEESRKLAWLAELIQVGGAVVGNLGALLLLTGTGFRRGSLKCFQLSLVSQEDLWVLSQVKMSELTLSGAQGESRNSSKLKKSAVGLDDDLLFSPSSSPRESPRADFDGGDEDDEEEAAAQKRFSSMRVAATAGSTSALRPRQQVGSFNNKRKTKKVGEFDNLK